MILSGYSVRCGTVKRGPKIHSRKWFVPKMKKEVWHQNVGWKIWPVPSHELDHGGRQGTVQIVMIQWAECCVVKGKQSVVRKQVSKGGLPRGGEMLWVGFWSMNRSSPRKKGLDMYTREICVEKWQSSWVIGALEVRAKEHGRWHGKKGEHTHL